MTLTAIVLTYNEQAHIGRCLASLRPTGGTALVVDSFSTDQTKSIAEDSGATVLQRGWKNYADQFNWAIDQLPADTKWVLRIDADEYLDETLGRAIREAVESDQEKVAGYVVSRHMAFMGRRIRHGGLFPVKVLRLFRRGAGRCEDRWMDEHIKVSGGLDSLKGELVDDNTKSLTWWIEKHNGYASREAVDLLNVQYGFMPHDTVASLSDGTQAGRKRWLKEVWYVRLPLGLRAALYFFYRYFLRFGFLDGREGMAFHFLQGFWYRYLVDMKVLEVERHLRRTGDDPARAIRRVLGIDVSR